MGITIPHNWEPRWYQANLWEYLTGAPFGAPGVNPRASDRKHAEVIWHRRAGKDEVCLHFAAREMFLNPANYWHMLPQSNQVRKAIWEAVNPHTGKRRIDEAFPPEVFEQRHSDMMIHCKANSATWQCLGSDNFQGAIGSAPRGIVYSEWPQANPSARGYLRPILLENKGWQLFIGTPRGRNHAYSTFRGAQQNPEQFAELLTVYDTRVLSHEDLVQELQEYVNTYGESMGIALFDQEYLCFKPDALVMCSDKAKKISDIRIGDTVLTHTGRFRRVDAIMSREYTGPMVRICVWGSKDIVCTPEHPIYVCNPSKQTYTWKKAKDVKDGDWLVTPKFSSGVPIISEGLAKLIAWFACEGHVSGNSLVFSLSAKEGDFVNEIQNIAFELGLLSKVTITGSVAQVSINSVVLSDFMVGVCGSLASNKRLPLAMLRGHETAVWQTMINGDGCVFEGNRGHRPTYCFTSISEGLVQQMQIIGASLGYSGSYTTRPARTGDILGRECDIKTSYCLMMRENSFVMKPGDKTRTAKNGGLGRVRKVLQEHYSGTVHNITIAGDNSYVVNGRAVHNCSFDAAILGAIYGEEMRFIRSTGRVTTIPHDDDYPVHISMDIGRTDDFSAWFFQVIGGEIRYIDHFSGAGKDADEVCSLILGRRVAINLIRRGDNTEIVVEMGQELPAFGYRRAYRIGKIGIPHDGSAKTFAAKGKSVEEQFAAVFSWGKILRVPRLSVQDGIQATRKALRRAVFDHKCEKGLDSLENYHREWDDDKKMFTDKPSHDWSSHDADSCRYSAVMWEFEPEIKDNEPTRWATEMTFNEMVESNRMRRLASE